MDNFDLQEYRRQRLVEAVDKVEGGNVTAFGKRVGYKDGAFIRQMISGSRVITEKTVDVIEAKAHLPGWFTQAKDHVATGGVRVGGAAVTSFTPAFPSITVPVLAQGPRIGRSSNALQDDVMVGSITLSQSWVAHRIRPSAPGALRFITAFDEAMSPTIEDGDVLLVDTGINAIKIDGVYVLRTHDRLFVKRVRQKLDGSFVVYSDNPNEKTVDELDEGHDVDVLGRVVWCWNGRKL